MKTNRSLYLGACVTGLVLGAVFFDAGLVSASVSADLVGKDASDNDARATSVGPFNYGTLKADLSPLTIVSALLIMITLTNGKVDSVTDQSYYLARIDSGAGGAGTIDLVATDIVSGAAVLSNSDSVLTFSTTSSVLADGQLVVVRSKDATSSSAHSYSDGDTAQTPTWIISEDSTEDFSANITGLSANGFVRIGLPRAPKFSTSFAHVTETVDVSNTTQFSSYVRSEYRLICSTPKYTSVSSQSYDDYDSYTMPALQLELEDDLPSTTGNLVDVGATAGWTDFTAGQLSVTTTMHGPMAAVSAIYWDMDNSGTYDSDELFTIDTNTNTATLTWDPAVSDNDQVSGGKRKFKIQFDGTTPLPIGAVFYVTVSASAGSVAATLEADSSVGYNGQYQVGGLYNDQSLCKIGSFNGARFRPNYLHTGSDNGLQVVRIGIDLDGGGCSGAELLKTSFDVYMRAVQVTGKDYVKVGTVTPPNELILIGKNIKTTLNNAGYSTAGAPDRLDVDFVIQGLGINYNFDAVSDPTKAFKLNVVSTQKTPNSWVTIPVRAIIQDASTNDVVHMQ